ncbi:MAG TPA: AMP-binding protein [Pseudonocardia sp.]|nr:AMP-binding protein [Pseudonocardia sp.]
MNLAEIGEFWARWQPEAVAIRMGGVDVSWAELDRRTRALAAGLQASGIYRGDRVGILAGNSIEWCELVLATFRVGAVVVPLNVRLSPPEISSLVADSGCTAVAMDSELAQRYRQIADRHAEVLRIGITDEVPADVSVSALRATSEAFREDGAEGPVEDDDVAIIGYTSGTTGKPRGVMLTHGNVLASANQWRQADGWTRDTNLLLCVPLAFTGGIVNNFMGTYGCGGTLVLEAGFDPVRALELIVSTPITAMAGVPVMFQGIASAPGFADADLSAFRTAITGGSPVPPSLLKTYQDKGVMIRQAYALTEASGSVCILPAEYALERHASAGLPQVHTRIRVVDEEGRATPAGEVGEIQVAGPQVMKGYWNDREASAAALAGGWLRTGDLGALDSDGFLSVVDRRNDKIISGGLNLYPAEIENVVAGFPGVTEVGAYGVPHPRWGETVAVSVGGAGIDVAELVAHCRANLGDYKVPRFVTIATDPLPRSMSGKILRRELRATFDESIAVPTGAS